MLFVKGVATIVIYFGLVHDVMSRGLRFALVERIVLILGSLYSQ